MSRILIGLSLAALVSACGSSAVKPHTTTGGPNGTNAGSGATGSSGTTGSTSSTTSGTTTGGSTTGSSTSGTTGTTGGCGTCPSGFTCGSANGHAVCMSANGIPHFTHVFVIPMENTSWSTLDQSTNTPFLHGLKQSAAYATDYHGVAHPSLPNYLAMVSGNDQGVGCDCDPTGNTSCDAFSCNVVNGSCSCPQTARTIAEQLEAANLSWRAYAEEMGAPCSTSDHGGYAVRHVPFLYFSGAKGDSAHCADHLVDYTNWGHDLDGGVRDFSFLTPNLTDDMHDPGFPNSGPQNLANGDGWLATQVPAILASEAYQSGGLLVIVWDEDDNSGGISGTDDPIPMFILSPYAKTGYASTVNANHYNLLATIQEGLGLARLDQSAGAAPMADYFSQP